MPDFEVVQKRNENRLGKVIPDQVILNMMKSFQIPFENESKTEYVLNY